MFDPTTLNDFTLEDANFADKFADVYVDWAEHADGTVLTDAELKACAKPDFDPLANFNRQRGQAVQTDAQPVCPECLAKLCWATGCDPLVRYRDLIEFCKQHDLTAEQTFYRRAFQLLAGE